MLPTLLPSFSKARAHTASCTHGMHSPRSDQLSALSFATADAMDAKKPHHGSKDWACQASFRMQRSQTLALLGWCLCCRNMKRDESRWNEQPQEGSIICFIVALWPNRVPWLSQLESTLHLTTPTSFAQLLPYQSQLHFFLAWVHHGNILGMVRTRASPLKDVLRCWWKWSMALKNPHMMTTFVILVHSMLMPSFTCLATNNCTGFVTLNTKAPKSPVHLALDLRLLAVPLHLLDPNTGTRHPNLSARNFQYPFRGWGNVWDFVVGNLVKCL